VNPREAVLFAFVTFTACGHVDWDIATQFTANDDFAVGVDGSQRQCEWATERLKAFGRREALVLKALQEGSKPGSRPMLALQKEAEGSQLSDEQVGVAHYSIDCGRWGVVTLSPGGC